MRNPTGSTITVQSNIDASDSQVMGIDVSGMNTVLSILSNMYSDGHLAVVREYACNARDSHVAAGNPNPIEVTLPSAFSPNLIVQDYGLGLTKDEVLKVYSQYGASTKRESNNQIGAFGIGSKSAFTVGAQFVVAAIKNREKTIAVFSLNESGSPTVTVASHEYDVNEPNGVKVEIGVPDINRVNEAATRLFSTWDIGTVLVNGKMPDSIWVDVTKLSDHTFFRFNKNNSRANIVLIMGGVPYTVNRDLFYAAIKNDNRFYPSDFEQICKKLEFVPADFYISVNIGEVEITPSREELRITPLTTRTLSLAIQELVNAIPPYIQNEIKDSKSITEAVYTGIKLTKRFGMLKVDQLSWNNQPLGPSSIETKYEYASINGGRAYGTYNVRLEENFKISCYDEPEKIRIITSVPKDKHGYLHRRIKPWLKQFGGSVAILSPHTQGKHGWFEYGVGSYLNTIDYETVLEEINAIRAANPTVSSKSATRYVTWVNGTYNDALTLTEIKALKLPVFYSSRYNYRGDHFIVKDIIQNAVLIKLSGQQQASTIFKRIPTAQDVSPLVKAEAQRVVDTFSEDDEAIMLGYAINNYLSSSSYQADKFLKENIGAITNPRLLNHISFKTDAVSAYENNRPRWQQIVEWYAAAEIDRPDTMGIDGLEDELNLLTNYIPLLTSISSHNLDKPEIKKHMLHYINTLPTEGL